MSSSNPPVSDRYEQELYNLHAYSSQEYDKNILFIATGALGISFAFIEKIVPLKLASHTWILFTGWFSLTLTIVIYIFSHRESKCQTEFYMEKLKRFKEGTISENDLEVERKKCNSKIENYDIGSATSLIIGITLILIFLAFNV